LEPVPKSNKIAKIMQDRSRQFQAVLSLTFWTKISAFATKIHNSVNDENSIFISRE
jgi:hypothetical protein